MLPSAGFQIGTVLSASAEARCRPPGRKARAFTGCLCPLNVRSNLPVPASQIRTVLSSPTEARYFRFGLRPGSSYGSPRGKRRARLLAVPWGHPDISVNTPPLDFGIARRDWGTSRGMRTYTPDLDPVALDRLRDDAALFAADFPGPRPLGRRLLARLAPRRRAPERRTAGRSGHAAGGPDEERPRIGLAAIPQPEPLESRHTGLTRPAIRRALRPRVAPRPNCPHGPKPLRIPIPAERSSTRNPVGDQAPTRMPPVMSVATASMPCSAGGWMPLARPRTSR